MKVGLVTALVTAVIATIGEATVADVAALIAAIGAVIVANVVAVHKLQEM